jgi:hypothetical protein
MSVPTLRLLIASVTFCALAAALAVTGVRAQTDLDAGKSGPQLFAQDCAACHRSPQGLLKNISSFGLVGFLRQHYTSSSTSANTVAAYLQAVANARPPDPKKGKGADPQQQAKQSPPAQARPTPPAEVPPGQAARPGEPATEQHERASRRPPRKQAPAETGSTPAPEPATAAARPVAPAEPAPPAPPAAAAQQAAAAPVEPGFAEPLP